MQKFKYKAALFDFDGTLFDTWPALALALKKTYQNYFNKTIDTEYLKPFSILSRKDLLAKLFNRPATTEEIDSFILTYTDLMLRDIVPYKGTYETLKFFNTNQIPWGIVTNKPRNYMELFIQHEPILETSSCLVCPQDVANRKPHPEPLQAACKTMNVQPEEVVFIGDSIHDIEAANECKMDCGLALYGYAGDISTFDHLNINYYLRDSLWEIVSGVSEPCPNV